jgi:hypothetical protein
MKWATYHFQKPSTGHKEKMVGHQSNKEKMHARVLFWIDNEFKRKQGFSWVLLLSKVPKLCLDRTRCLLACKGYWIFHGVKEV